MQINKIRNEKGDFTMDTTEIQILREFYKQLYDNKMDYLKKWTNSRKVQPFKTEPGRNRNYEQSKHKY